jgi:transcriptional regulator with GAF, ATPase, and Fis domain
MSDLAEYVIDQNTINEDLLRDRLINYMIVTWAISASCGLIITLIRTLEIGWTGRDFVQVLLVVIVNVVTLYRKKISMRLKAIFLTTINMILGIVGFYTLGILAASIFLLPMAVLIVSILYSKKTISLFAVLSLLVLATIAFGFTSGQISMPSNANLILSNSKHWFIYIFCIGFFYLFNCVTILAYRQAMGQLASIANCQRSELLESNKALSKTLVELENEVAEKKRTKAENIYLQQEIKLTYNFNEIIGKSKKIKNVLRQIEQVATTDTTVLISGETGTGKELLARAVHNLSDRKNRSLVKVNCAALPSDLIENELFGHVKGAFTGALDHKIGRFELANNGTIFLDEIGDLPMDLQSKLLRVLQDGEFERLGSSDTLQVDVRIIAATNKNLQELHAEGKFRQDLFFRLNVFPIEAPPLRERQGDIPMLTRHFVDKFNTKTGKTIVKLPKSTINELKNYHWPGNIRELENVIERAVVVSPDDKLQLKNWTTADLDVIEKNALSTLDDLQREHIMKVLKSTSGKVGGEHGAAKILGLHRTTLQSKMKRFGIKIERNTADI